MPVPGPHALSLALIALALSSSLAAQEPQNPPPPITRPGYQFLRQNEDWSLFRGVPDAQLTDFWDPTKYIPLNEDGSNWLSTGGSLRLRWEGWHNFGFGEVSPNDDNFLLTRLMIHADLRLGESFRAFVQGKSAHSTDRDLAGGNGTLYRDQLALEQAFVDVVAKLDEDKDLTLRPGRQALSFGKQRLMSPLPWANTLRRWDGVSAIYDTSGWDATAFYTVFAPVQKYEFNDGDGDLPLWGLYTTGKVPSSEVGLDLYYLGYGNDMMPTFNGTTGDETRHTFGTRVFGNMGEGDWDYDGEFAYQFGEVGSGDVSAYMFGGELGYTLSGGWSPRVVAGFDLASGDNSAGGDVQTFNQLYPWGHPFLGFIDIVGRQNIIAPSLGAIAKPNAAITLGARYTHYWRHSDEDALYNAGGAVVRAGSAGSSSEIGGELDLTVNYRFGPHTVGLLGYSHFFSGDFIEESGSSDDIDFVYLQMEYTF